MTAAELVRYNLARLVRESGRRVVDIAIQAWPLPVHVPETWGWPWPPEVSARCTKLRRYLGEVLRDGEPVTIPLEELDNLARALDCKRADFLQEPQN